MTPTRPRIFSRSATAKAFVLLEVLVSLTIMGIALAMVLESFTSSLKAARRSEQIATASIIARELIEYMEIEPPESSVDKKDCGEQYPDYYYRLKYDNTTAPDYDNIPFSLDLDEGRLAVARSISLDIYYQKKNSETKPRLVMHVETALTGAERFSDTARRMNQVRFDK